jgi:hypothetical protein
MSKPGCPVDEGATSLGMSWSTNVYEYSNNDPLNFLDVTGLKPGRPNSSVYDTVEGAAVAALQYAAKQPGVDNRELAGKIYSVGNGYSFSVPTSNGSTPTSSFPDRSRVPNGCEVIAIYHTHLSGDKAGLSLQDAPGFSMQDVKSSRQSGLPDFTIDPQGNVWQLPVGEDLSPNGKDPDGSDATDFMVPTGLFGG